MNTIDSIEELQDKLNFCNVYVSELLTYIQDSVLESYDYDIETSFELTLQDRVELWNINLPIDEHDKLTKIVNETVSLYGDDFNDADSMESMIDTIRLNMLNYNIGDVHMDNEYLQKFCLEYDQRGLIIAHIGDMLLLLN